MGESARRWFCRSAGINVCESAAEALHCNTDNRIASLTHSIDPGGHQQNTAHFPILPPRPGAFKPTVLPPRTSSFHGHTPSKIRDLFPLQNLPPLHSKSVTGSLLQPVQYPWLHLPKSVAYGRLAHVHESAQRFHEGAQPWSCHAGAALEVVSHTAPRGGVRDRRSDPCCILGLSLALRKPVVSLWRRSLRRRWRRSPAHAAICP